MSIIRISGHHGSGKTTLCAKLAERLGYGYSYAGKIFRDMAAERGMGLNEFYALLKDYPELEREVDDRQTKLMNTQDNYVVEGRMAPFLPATFPVVNVLFTVADEARYLRQSQREENIGKTLEEVRHQSEVRLVAEKEHYKRLYDIDDHFDPAKFHIIIDTTNLTAEEVLNKMVADLRLYLEEA